MNPTLLRMVAGYSRFALQQERKHNRVLGSILYSDSLTKFYINGHFLESGKSITNMPGTPQKPIYVQPIHETEIIDRKRITHIQQKGETIEYRISAIQYEANKGIEDRLVVDRLKSIKAETVSVFDGHGGDQLSDYCANHVVELMDNFLQKNKNSEKYVNDVDKLICDSLVYTYQKLDRDFYQNVFKALVSLNSKKIKKIGTCALTIVIYDKKIYVASCGDSEAIAVYKGLDQQTTFLQLGERFSANNPVERQRLTKQFPEDPDIIVQEPNGCFYVKGRLQPTRALGDYHLKYSHLYRGTGKFNGPYIKSTPEVKIIPVENKFERLVIGSDGIWDFLNKKSVAEASLEKNPHEKILEMALKRVAEKNRKSIEQIKEISVDEKRLFHDDISIAVVDLIKTGNSSS